MSNQGKGNKSPYPLQYTYVPTAGVPTIPQPMPTYIPGSPYPTTYQLVPSYGYYYRYGIPGQEALAQGLPPSYSPSPASTIPQQTMLVHGAYDAGARFDGISGQMIPPPPPGYAPNATQMAAMQGQNVILTQRKNDFLTGGSGGGYTWY